MKDMDWFYNTGLDHLLKLVDFEQCRQSGSVNTITIPDWAPQINLQARRLYLAAKCRAVAPSSSSSLGSTINGCKVINMKL